MQLDKRFFRFLLSTDVDVLSWCLNNWGQGNENSLQIHRKKSIKRKFQVAQFLLRMQLGKRFFRFLLSTDVDVLSWCLNNWGQGNENSKTLSVIF